MTAPLILLMVALGITASASAEPNGKLYTASAAATPSVAEDDFPADPAAEVWAGSSTVVTITLTNRTSPQALGSANLTLPAGVAFTTAGFTLSSDQSSFAGRILPPSPDGVVRLRDLALLPGRSIFLAMPARAECVPLHAPYAFGTTVKQSNDFSGTGNDFLIDGPPPALDLVGSCSLGFSAQPADTQKSLDITHDVFLPLADGGAPVAVEVLDGSGSARVTWWSTPITLGIGQNPGATQLVNVASVTPTSGLARFSTATTSPKIAVTASNYTLTAQSAGIGAPTATFASDPFDIVDKGRRCGRDGNPVCIVDSGLSVNSTATVSASAGLDDLLRVSLRRPEVVPFSCAGYTSTTQVLDFDLTTLAGAPTGGVKTAVFTLLKSAGIKAPQKYDVCYQTPLSPAFTTKSGAPAQLASGFYVGLLPSCSSRGPVPPCVASKGKDSDGNVVLTLLAPAGDPRAKF